MKAYVSPEDIAAQRDAGWPDFHPETYCHRCGRRNIASWFAPEWMELQGESAGILCPVCFADNDPDALWVVVRYEESAHWPDSGWIIEDCTLEPDDFGVRDPKSVADMPNVYLSRSEAFALKQLVKRSSGPIHPALDNDEVYGKLNMLWASLPREGDR